MSLEKNLKNLLLELTIENIEPKKLKEKLLIIYEEYLSPNRKNIKKYLGREIENQIFNLYNNGLVKHKEEKNIEKLSKFNDNDILDALIWLKDIILFYFTCCHKKTPEKLLIK